jgi:hypothetical protein
VRTYRESGGWKDLPTGVKEISIAGAVDETTVDAVCSYPGLEKLKFWPFPTKFPDRSPYIARDTFNVALLKAAPTLRYLRFETRANRILRCYYGPAERLTCLPRLTKLTHLTTELFALFGRIENMQKLHLADLLPPGLQTLELSEVWWYDIERPWLNQSDVTPAQARDAKAQLVQTLLLFARDCPTRVPSLRKFIFRAWSSDAGHYLLPGSLELPDMKTPFQEVGVDFVLRSRRPVLKQVQTRGLR